MLRDKDESSKLGLVLSVVGLSLVGSHRRSAWGHIGPTKPFDSGRSPGIRPRPATSADIRDLVSIEGVNPTLLTPKASGSAPAVALRDVRKVYGRGEGVVVALDGVSAALRPGSFTAIMGPSGSGKSTFLNVAAGLDRPTSGRVAFTGALVALFAAAVLSMAWGMQLESILRTHPPVERYAGAAAVVTGQQKAGADHDVLLGERA